MKLKIVFLFFILVCPAIQSDAQVTAVWKGGNPGKERDWHFPSNWSLNRVPDEFTDVVIPVDKTSLNNYPVIFSQLVEIHSLVIHHDACVRLAPGSDLRVLSAEASDFRPEAIIRTQGSRSKSTWDMANARQ